MNENFAFKTHHFLIIRFPNFQYMIAQLDLVNLEAMISFWNRPCFLNSCQRSASSEKLNSNAD